MNNINKEKCCECEKCFRKSGGAIFGDGRRSTTYECIDNNCVCHSPKEEKIKCGEVHSCCNKRIRKEGGKAQCCYCVPHSHCELKLSSPSKTEDGEWSKEFYNRFPINEIAEGKTKWGDYTLFQLHESITDFIRNLLADREKEIGEKVALEQSLNKDQFYEFIKAEAGKEAIESYKTHLLEEIGKMKEHLPEEWKTTELKEIVDVSGRIGFQQGLSSVESIIKGIDRI